MKILATITPAFVSAVLSASPAYANICFFDEDCIPANRPGFVACCCANKCESVCPCTNNCLFSINYSEDGCEESKSAVGLNAYLQHELYTISVTQQLPCAEAMTCRMDAENNQDMCPEDQMKEIALQLDLDEDTGNIISVLSNFTVGPDVCSGGPSNQGVEESWFDCYFSYWTLDNLKAQPEVLANDNPDDLVMMQKYSYLVYYEDDACTDLASIIPSVNGMSLDIPSVSNTDLTCNRQAMCAIDPNSEACKAVLDEDTDNVQVNIETRLDETTGTVNVYSCDSSNVAAGEEECNLQLPSGCGKSSIYSNCYFRYLSGPTLAQNPRFLVGEVDEENSMRDDSPDNSVEVNDLMATDPNSMYVFSVSYSAEGCSDSSSAVMFRSFLADTASPDVMASTQMGFCAQNLMCMVDPEGNPNMCPTPTGGEDSTTAMYTIDLSIGDDGIISNTRNQTRGPDVCLFGSWYSGEGQDCYYNVKLLENFKQTPELMANDNPQDLEMMKEYIYLAYYEDDTCTDLSAIVTTASGKQIDLPQVSNPDLSCNIQAICGVDPASPQCKAIQDEAAAVAERFAETRVNPETNELDVYECDSSNEAVGQEECALFRPQDCGESSIFTNCYFRYISGPEFATNPRVVVGEVLADSPDPEIETPSNSTGTDMDGDMDGMAPDGIIIEQLGACIVPSDLGKDVIDTECIQAVLSSLDPTVIEQLAECAGLGSFAEMQACVEERLSDATTSPVSDPTEPPTSSACGSSIIAKYAFVTIVYAAVLCIY